MSSSRRHRLSAVLALAVALVLGVAACGGSDDEGDQSSAQSGPRTMTIWLMEGSAPPKVVDAVNAEWKKAHPNDTVKVELQQWNNITTKLDAAFAGSSPPDVVELGNTLVSKYAAAGALQDLSGSRDQFENNQAWLQSLTESCTMDGKLVCAPYLAGSRAVIYRKSMFAKAGITKAPASLEELQADAEKLMADLRLRQAVLGLLLPRQVLVRGAPLRLGPRRRHRRPGRRPVARRRWTAPSPRPA